MRRTFLTASLLFVPTLLFWVGCSSAPDNWAATPATKVVAYFPPLYSLTAAIAGSDAQVHSLITNVGPHNFEPSARDARILQRADLFVTLGLGLDDAVSNRLCLAAGNAKLKQVAVGDRLPKDLLREGDEDKDDANKDHHEHEHGSYDPHVWLAPTAAAMLAETIGEQMAAVDPSHAADYAKRTKALAERLRTIQAEGKAQLAKKKEKARLISFHDSLFYFARDFGVEIVDSIEMPGQEASKKKIDHLVEACKKHNVRLIAVEPQYPSNTAARVLLEELKRNGIEAAFIEIDPMETADPSDLTADWYERTMRANLKNLAAALK